MDERLKGRCGREVVLLLPDGREYGGARAVFECLANGGGFFLATGAKVMRLPPLIWVAEIAYRIIARHRRFLSRLMLRETPTCSISAKNEPRS